MAHDDEDPSFDAMNLTPVVSTGEKGPIGYLSRKIGEAIDLLLRMREAQKLQSQALKTHRLENARFQKETEERLERLESDQRADDLEKAEKRGAAAALAKTATDEQRVVDLQDKRADRRTKLITGAIGGGAALLATGLQRLIEFLATTKPPTH